MSLDGKSREKSLFSLYFQVRTRPDIHFNNNNNKKSLGNIFQEESTIIPYNMFIYVYITREVGPPYNVYTQT